VRVNDDNQSNQSPQPEQIDATEGRAREPYTPPVIEKFPPMSNVTFGTNVQPTTAITIAGG
jgi:hypothetical protein